MDGALKIEDIIYDEDDLAVLENRETDKSAIIYPAEEGYVPFRVTAEYLEKHNPYIGGIFYIKYTG